MGSYGNLAYVSYMANTVVVTASVIESAFTGLCLGSSTTIFLTSCLYQIQRAWLFFCRTLNLEQFICQPHGIIYTAHLNVPEIIGYSAVMLCGSSSWGL